MGHHRKRSHLPSTRRPPMAQGHCRQPVVPGHQARRKRTQFTSQTWRNGIPVVKIRRNISAAQPQALPSIRLPGLRPSGTASNSESLPEMGRALQNRHLPMPLTSSRIFRAPHSLHANWTS